MRNDPSTSRTWAIDPGAVASGLAWIDGASCWDALQFDDPVELYQHLTNSLLPQDVVLIEDYSHGGTFTAEAKATLKIVGFMEYALTEGQIVSPVLRHKDKRLPGQRDAAQLMGKSVADLKKDPHRKDAFSALAHCIMYRYEMAMGL